MIKQEERILREEDMQLIKDQIRRKKDKKTKSVLDR